MSEQFEIHDNRARERYELILPEGKALVEYRLLETKPEIIFSHTEVPEALEGRGIGSALARHVLDDARARGLKVVPLCPFINSYIRRHPEYKDLVAY